MDISTDQSRSTDSETVSVVTRLNRLGQDAGNAISSSYQRMKSTIVDHFIVVTITSMPII